MWPELKGSVARGFGILHDVGSGLVSMAKELSLQIQGHPEGSVKGGTPRPVARGKALVDGTRIIS